MAKSALDAMVKIAGATFLIGSGVHYPEEKPTHEVVVDSFCIDRHTVTNAEFSIFIDATGYIPTSERLLDAMLYPGTQEGMLKPGSTVFRMPARAIRPRDQRDWWEYVPGADCSLRSARRITNPHGYNQ